MPRQHAIDAPSAHNTQRSSEKNDIYSKVKDCVDIESVEQLRTSQRKLDEYLASRTDAEGVIFVDGTRHDATEYRARKMRELTKDYVGNALGEASDDSERTMHSGAVDLLSHVSIDACDDVTWKHDADRGREKYIAEQQSIVHELTGGKTSGKHKATYEYNSDTMPVVQIDDYRSSRQGSDIEQGNEIVDGEIVEDPQGIIDAEIVDEDTFHEPLAIESSAEAQRPRGELDTDKQEKLAELQQRLVEERDEVAYYAAKKMGLISKTVGNKIFGERQKEATERYEKTRNELMLIKLETVRPSAEEESAIVIADFIEEQNKLRKTTDEKLKSSLIGRASERYSKLSKRKKIAVGLGVAAAGVGVSILGGAVAGATIGGSVGAVSGALRYGKNFIASDRNRNVESLSEKDIEDIRKDTRSAKTIQDISERFNKSFEDEEKKQVSRRKKTAMIAMGHTALGAGLGAGAGTVVGILGETLHTSASAVEGAIAERIADATAQSEMGEALSQSFTVESGSGYINEISQMAEGMGHTLTAEQATALHQEMYSKFGSYIELDGHDVSTYTMGEGVGNVGIVAPGEAHFSQEAQQYLQERMSAIQEGGLPEVSAEPMPEPSAEPTPEASTGPTEAPSEVSTNESPTATEPTVEGTKTQAIASEMANSHDVPAQESNGITQFSNEALPVEGIRQAVAQNDLSVLNGKIPADVMQSIASNIGSLEYIGSDDVVRIVSQNETGKIVFNEAPEGARLPIKVADALRTIAGT